MFCVISPISGGWMGPARWSLVLTQWHSCWECEVLLSPCLSGTCAHEAQTWGAGSAGSPGSTSLSPCDFSMCSFLGISSAWRLLTWRLRDTRQGARKKLLGLLWPHLEVMQRISITFWPLGQSQKSGPASHERGTRLYLLMWGGERTRFRKNTGSWHYCCGLFGRCNLLHFASTWNDNYF